MIKTEKIVLKVQLLFQYNESPFGAFLKKFSLSNIHKIGQICNFSGVFFIFLFALVS